MALPHSGLRPETILAAEAALMALGSDDKRNAHLILAEEVKRILRDPAALRWMLIGILDASERDLNHARHPSEGERHDRDHARHGLQG